MVVQKKVYLIINYEMSNAALFPHSFEKIRTEKSINRTKRLKFENVPGRSLLLKKDSLQVLLRVAGS